MDFQRFEDESAIRIKFASERGRRLLSDALDTEYNGLFVGPAGQASWIPAEWTVGNAGLIETLSEHQQPAWHFTADGADVLAVEHETGIEVLILLPIVTGLATNAITGLTKSLWKEWRRRRRTSEPVRQGYLGQEVLRVETTTERPDGTRSQRVVTVPAALVSDETFDKLFADF
jgi:hypothetical protein